MERTNHFRLLAVPAGAPVKPSTKWLPPRRAIAGFFVWVLLSGLGSLAPPPSYAATSCGGDGQRACCVTERAGGIFGPPCNSGLHEVPGCSGECSCGGFNPIGAASIGHCAAPLTITPCGGDGQRACCVTERIPSCNPGLIEYLGCTTGNCTCGGPGPNPGGVLKSIGHCAPPPVITPCGGDGQRACCVTERIPSCNPGLIEYLGCTTGNCTCGGPGPNPGGVLKSIGHCAPPPVTPQQPVTSGPAGGAQQGAGDAKEGAGAAQQGAGAAQQGAGGKQGAGAAQQGAGGKQGAGGAQQGAGGKQQVVPTMKQDMLIQPVGPRSLPARPVEGAGGAQQVVPTMKQNVGGSPGGLPAGPVKGPHCSTAKNNLASIQARKTHLETQLARLNADLVTMNNRIAAARQAVQQQCGPAGGAQQVVPTMKQNVGVPGGLPAKPIVPGGLQRPVTK